MRTLLLLLFTTICLPVFAQEICDNGVDDDGDGLIDIQDDDCVCAASFAGLTGDFEEFSCCPTTFTFAPGDGYFCIDDEWTFLSEGTTDYFNTCGYMGGFGLPDVPTPIPSGNGAVGMYTQNTFIPYIEGIARCLDCQMIAGQSYDISFFIGFGVPTFGINSSDAEFALYGQTDCANVPSTGFGCPTDIGWTEITTFQVDAVTGSWVPVNGSFVATENYAAIGFGASCDFLNSSAGLSEYHFIDDMEITGNFSGPNCGNPITVSAEVIGSCVTGYFLSAFAPDAVQFQWYLDGVAIAGATTNPWFVDPITPGDYQVLATSADGSCVISDPIPFSPDLNTLTVTSDETEPSCPGGNDGSIDLNIGSNNTPFNINWSTGDNTDNIDNLSAGTYSVTVTDANGCFTELSITLDDPPSTVSTADITQPTGTDGGSVSISTMNGTPPYQYIWDNGLVGANQTDLDPGTYTVTIIDANGCEEIITITINDFLGVSALTFDEICAGQCQGAAIVTPTGGQPPYSYTWSIPGNTDTQVGLCAGDYDYTITDANSTQLIGSVSIQEGDVLAADIEQVGIRCDDDETVDLNLTINDGSAPYNFNWSTGATTEDLVGVQTGNYSVTVIDGIGCQVILETDVLPVVPLQLNAVVTDVSCQTPEGSITIFASGGQNPLQYQWSSGQTSNQITGIGAGDYDLTITDGNGCFLDTTFTVQSSVALGATAAINPPSCATDLNGSIDLTTSGTDPIVYAWSNGADTEDITGLAAGNYTVTITDGSNCSVIQSYTLTAASSLTIDATVNPTSCFGGSDGSIGINANATLTPISFNWSNGDSTNTITNLEAGDYSLTITDAAGCTYFADYEVTAPDLFVIDSVILANNCFGDSTASIEIIPISPGNYQADWNTGDSTLVLSNLSQGTYAVTVTSTAGCEQLYDFDIVDSNPPLAVMVNQSPPICGVDNGSLMIDPSGGLGPYTFNWFDGTTEASIANLGAGDYDYTVTDALGCTFTAQTTLTEGNLIAITETIVEPTCIDATNGEINLAISGGLAPFNVSWSNGGNGPSLTGLAGGTYTAEIIDANGCTESRTYTLVPTSSLSITTNLSDVTCFGGSDGAIGSIVAASLPPLTYSWSNSANTLDISNLSAGTFTLTITDAAGCPYDTLFTITEPPLFVIDSLIVTNDCFGDSSAQIQLTPPSDTTYTISWNTGDDSTTLANLTAGNYTASVTSALGCEQVYNFSIDDEIPPVLGNLTTIDPSCGFANGVISTSISGGTQPYQYNWSNGATTENISDLEAGSYILTVTDLLGCEITIDTSLLPYPDLVLGTDITAVDCAGDATGSIDATPNGGTAPYTYSWSTTANDPQIAGLSAGSYSLTITDALGCQLADTFQVVEPAPLDISQLLTPPNCFGDSATVLINPAGGVGPYNLDGAISATNFELRLLASDYNFVITDANNCTINVPLSIDQPLVLEGEITSTTDPDLGVDNGSISASANGGTPPFTYNWSNGDTGPTINGLGAGTYLVTVTDANGCQIILTTSLEAPLPLSIISDLTNAPCADECEGVISVQAAGGTLPYTINWSDGQVGTTASNLCPGQYQATLIDANGNTLTSEVFTITAPDPIEITGTVAAVSCVDQNDGAISANVIGGVGPYEYRWNGQVGTATLSNQAAGTFALNVTDNNGCVLTSNFTVPDYVPQDFSFTTDVVSCEWDEYAITIQGAATNQVEWLLNDEAVTIGNTGIITGIPPGNYTLSYQDGPTCVVPQESFQFDGLAPYVLFVDESPRELEFGDVLTLNLRSTPAQQVLQRGTINWTTTNPFDCVGNPSENCNTIELRPEISEVIALSYLDEIGCQTNFRIPIFVAEPNYAYIPNAFSPNGDGVNDAFAIFTTDFVEEIQSVRIYDRWGGLAYETFDLPAGEQPLWDGNIFGEPANAGVFVYYLQLRLRTGEVAVLSGDVTLIR